MGASGWFIVGFLAGIILAGCVLAVAVWRSSVSDGEISWEDGQ